MAALLGVAVELASSCCGDETEVDYYELEDGTFEFGGNIGPPHQDATIAIERDEFRIDYEGDDGARYRVTYAIVDREWIFADISD